MGKPLLMIMSPRRIPQCVAALESLDIDKVWMRNFSEHELMSVIPQVIAECDHDTIGLISDDCIPTQDALDLVLDAYEPSAVYTGYSNITDATALVNLCDAPLIIQEEATVECYPMIERSVIDEYPYRLMRSYFAGFSFTFMSREFWERYPFVAYGHPGCQSDYQLCKRLQADGVNIWAVRGAFILHLKRGETTTHLEGGEIRHGNGQGSVEWVLRGS
jgi:hypothetical protein